MTEPREAQSENTRPRSRPMTLVGERQEPDQPPTLTTLISNNSSTTPRTGTPPPSAALQQEFKTRSAWQAGVMGALNVLTAVLAVRLTLLVSVCGASALAWAALAEPDPYRLGTLGVYAVVVVLPLVWLTSRR